MKLIITLIALILMNVSAFAQTGPVRTEQIFIFQNIDKTLIPTGYLNEYGPEVVYKKWLNGILSDSNLVADINLFNFLYNDIENSRIVNPIVLPPLDTARVMIDITRYDTLTKLVFFSANYASLREDALQQNLFTKVGNQIFDVAGRTQSPYILSHTFAAVPVLPESKFTNEIRLGYSPLFYGNTGNTIAAVQVNFLDGTGYQNIYSNGTATPVIKTYSDSTGFKKFAVKVIYSNGSIDECYTGQTVKVVLPPSGNIVNRYELLLPSDLNNPLHRVVPSGYLNVNPEIPAIFLSLFPNASTTQNLLSVQKFNQDMKIYIRYSKTRIGTALANKIVKPFIVVEGYDITDASQLLKPNNYNINSLIGEWNTLTASYDFNKKLDEDAGYDLIFVDYYTMRSITENADYLLQAIDWINSQKVNNAAGVREQNVVMGISMGGLVSRYALAKRSKLTGTNSTETKQLLTMDSPHQGANVPLGLQHFLYDFGEAKIVKKIADISDELKAFYNLNTLPATQQQLILRVTDGNGGRVNNTFLADGGPYRTMIDYNAPYPFYAVSNGSQCAVPVMQPGTLLLKKEGNVASANWQLFFYNNKYRLNIQVNALPAYGTQSQVCSVVMERNIRLFWGAIGTGWKTTSNTAPRISPANTIPWDGVPGGTKSTETTGPISQTSTTPAINQSNTFLGNVWRSVVFLLFNVNANIQLPFSQKEFTFVPITSALDVQNVTATTFSQSFNFAANGLLGSRAIKYITQQSAGGLFNIGHTDFTPRNAEWLYNEMENLPQTVSCLDHCGMTTINGPITLCGTNTYRVLKLPPGSTVTWSATASGLVSFGSPSLPQTTVSQTGSGTATLRVTISNACNSPAVTKIISVGAPSPNSYSVLGAATVYASAGYYYSAGYLGNATFVTNPFWRVPADWTIVSGQGTNNIQVMTGNTGGAVEMDFDNVCGERTGVFKTVQIGVGGPAPLIVTDPQSRQSSVAVLTVVATPNPANNNVTITLVSKEMGTKRSTMNVIEQIRITDKTGMQKRQFSFKSRNSSQNISLSGLAPDTYVVQVFNGEQWLSIKLLVL